MRANFCKVLFVLFGFISCYTSKLVKEHNNTRLLGTGYGINSATILVQHLDSARNYYAKVLGFNVPQRDKFGKGIYDETFGVSVNFPDLSSIELMSIKGTGLVEDKHSFITSFLKQYEGLRMYSLSTSSVETTHHWITSQGFKPDSIKSGRSAYGMPKGWDYDDGGSQWKHLGFNRDNPPAYLPGFMEWIGFPYEEMQDSWKPYDWRQYYVDHPNGVVGISSLLIVVDSLKAASKEFKKIGLIELEANDTLVRFRIAHNQELHLMASKSPGDELSTFLKTRGPGVFAIRFEIKNLKRTQAFLEKKLPGGALLVDTLLKHLTVLKEYAYGVQLEFTEESSEQAALARSYLYNESSKLDSLSLRYASGLYTKYCAVCHGKDREGYGADNAPSLRSYSLMATTQLPKSSYNYLSHTIAYGRSGTAMGPYSKSQGGPLDEDDIDLLIHWLHELSGVKKPIEMSTEPIAGNVALGKTLYSNHCAECHGIHGEGVSAPALANPILLATASDAFLHYTISNGREHTPMRAFKDSLSGIEINALTAFIRSRASGWNAPEVVSITTPQLKDYVLNPNNKAPTFTLREERYVPAEQLLKALKDSSRMILLDARSQAAWHQTHIPGAISVPYYEEPDRFKDIPNDDTWIVAYCACPHVVSEKVVNTLRSFGYKHTAILDEGILVWAQRGYPVQYGLGNEPKK